MLIFSRILRFLTHSRKIASQVVRAIMNWLNVLLYERFLFFIRMLNSRRSMRDTKNKYSIAWISSWNAICGIATYSDHLTTALQHQRLAVFAPWNAKKLKRDKKYVYRIWQQGKERNNLDGIYKLLNRLKIQCVVIQFHYGLYNFRELKLFLEKLKENGKHVIVMMHATQDPENVCPVWNYSLRTIVEALNRVDGVLVHTNNDLTRLTSLGLKENVVLFPHGILTYERRQERGNPTGQRVIATYGFCRPHKGLKEILEAVFLLKSEGKVDKLIMVNAAFPRPDSKMVIKELKKYIQINNMSDYVELHTEFLEDLDSLQLLSQADLIVFPYQHSNESASGAIRYGLAVQKPVAVTPLEIFKDILEMVYELPGFSADDLARGISDTFCHIESDSELALGKSDCVSSWLKENSYTSLGLRLSEICQTACFPDSGERPALKTSNQELSNV
jgi:O-antigen biosynthesis alpha-1,2-mannosyltransferase